MKNMQEISKTAYLTSAFRAIDKRSKDIYANFFINNDIAEFAKVYAKDVCNKESILQAIRNRFFLNSLNDFINENPDGIFVNLGSGFSMYPYLLNHGIQFIDIDQENIIAKKQKIIKGLKKGNKLPIRNVDFLSIDLVNNRGNLSVELNKRIGDRKSFILLEGVVYYWDKKYIQQLFQMISKIQVPGSSLALLLLSNKFFQGKIQQKFTNFMYENSDIDKLVLTHLSDEELHSFLQDYKGIVHTNYVELSKKLDIGNITNEDDIFWENFHIFEKTI